MLDDAQMAWLLDFTEASSEVKMGKFESKTQFYRDSGEELLIGISRSEIPRIM